MNPWILFALFVVVLALALLMPRRHHDRLNPGTPRRPRPRR